MLSIASSSMDENSLVLRTQDPIKSSHYSIRRLIIWITLFVAIALFYMMANCPNTNHLFSHNDDQHYLVGELTKSHMQKKKLCPIFGHVHGLLPSLMVKPLKNVSRSYTVQQLTEEKLQRLFKIAKHYMNKKQLMNCTDKQFYHSHREAYIKRRARLNRVCNSYGFLDRIFNTWHLSTNRRRFMSTHRYHHYEHDDGSNKTISDKYKYCSTRTCPLLVNDNHRLVTCFVQKIASTTIKRLYLYLRNQNLSAIDSNDTINQSSIEPVDNLSNFHFKSNDQLYRISPTFLVHSREAQYYKAIFVRHPFVRVVSAFKDKAERQPEEEQYFYERYWNPLLDKLHGKQHDPTLRVTFKEFVDELLLPTDPYQYDEHWAPIWTRCEPCLVHYDFIGKLETSEEDFRNFKSRVNGKLINVTVWENLNEQFSSPIKNNASSLLLKKCQRQRLKYAETIRYLSQLSSKSLIELYKRYYLDFELFGYTMDELFELITN
ncbi:chondroitin 4-sulfotransferase-like protein [Dermatophagoides farinae]|uniref:Carbohydrate sulfotransferase n=1 Tax=Dermatophagoides farinae TaxID=6954 RepID=A0A9D4SHI2_DERFA|nr:carbohydrate sulfotransferase 11-like [Dermatophagoides farinae]KAH7642112.1 chondroitin 4-sulfotransferase-like protein [Dermatophagoides farinae]